jgi:hypothetical protein
MIDPSPSAFDYTKTSQLCQTALEQCNSALLISGINDGAESLPEVASIDQAT